MSKPALPFWDRALSNSSEPPDAKKDAGAKAGRPESKGFFNWLFSRNWLWLRGLQGQYADIVVGSAAQVTAAQAQHEFTDDSTLAAFAAAVADRDRILWLGNQTHTLTENLALTENDLRLLMEAGAVLDLDNTYTITLSGARVQGRLRVTNAPDGSIILSGAGTDVEVEGAIHAVFALSNGAMGRIVGAVSVPVAGRSFPAAIRLYGFLLSEVGLFIAPALSVTAAAPTPRGVAISPDGLKMLVVDQSTAEINPYTLGTPWDVTTAVFDDPNSNGTGFDVSAQDTAPHGIAISPDGLKMLIVGNTGDDVNPYTLGTPWDVTTAVFDDPNSDGTGFDVSGQDMQPGGIYVSPDGLKMFITGNSGNEINPYTLGTPWDVTTAVFDDPNSDGTGFDVSGQDTAPSGIYFEPGGTRMYVSGAAGGDINPYTFGTPWDVTTAVFDDPNGDGTGFDVSAQDAQPEDVFFDPGGMKMFVVGGAGDTVNQFLVGRVGT